VEPSSQKSGKTWANCAQAADKAVEWIASRIFDKAWAAKHNDVIYYFRAPLAFLEVGREADAERALDLAVKWATTGGSGSAHREYAMTFPQYPVLWICWAACRLGRMDLARKCFSSIEKYAEPITCSATCCGPYVRNTANQFDYFATALLAKAALLCGDLHLAALAGDSLLRGLQANRHGMENGRFLTRWTWAGGLVEDHEKDPWYCVLQKGSGQLFFLLGFPASVLAELELEGCRPELSGTTFRAGALELLQYLQKCDGVLNSPSSHQVACAATRTKEDDIALKIANNLLKLQQASGAFNADTEALDAVDQAAEMSICLRQMGKDYRKAQTGKGSASAKPLQSVMTV